MSNFEIVDRRRNKEERKPEPVQEVPQNAGEWEDVGYLIVFIPSNGGPIVAGRAAGLRGDGKTFVADYFLPQIYPEHFDWTVEARKRLDTFLGCECSSSGPCAVHKLYLDQWLQADIQRIQLIGNSPVPKAIEMFMKAEQAKRASSIAIPRG